MLSQLTNALLVLTAFAPVLFTYAFVAYRHGTDLSVIALLVGAALVLTAICWGLLRVSRQLLPEVSPFRAVGVKPVDTELLTYVVAYLLPLVNVGGPTVDWYVLSFIVLLLIALVWATHAYHFNPLLALFGYHFYEVTSSGGITYVMLSSADLRSVDQITRVKQLGAYTLMDASQQVRRV